MVEGGELRKSVKHLKALFEKVQEENSDLNSKQWFRIQKFLTFASRDDPDASERSRFLFCANNLTVKPSLIINLFENCIITHK